MENDEKPGAPGITPEDADDIEKFLSGEKTHLRDDLKQIQDELKRLHYSLSVYMETVDAEIKDAFEKGDDKGWLSLTNKKNIMLQRLAELNHIIEMQPRKNSGD